VATYSGANIGSDHDSLIEILKFKRKHNQKKNKVYNISSLRKREMTKDELDKHIRFNNNESKNIEEQWWNIKNSIHNALGKILGYRKKINDLEKNG